jgi:hypothetical protein
MTLLMLALKSYYGSTHGTGNLVMQHSRERTQRAARGIYMLHSRGKDRPSKGRKQ